MANYLQKTMPIEERDLRSLERRSMYSIFAPLDPQERLPRELLLEGKRQRRFDIRRLELAGALYLPALMVAVIVMGSMKVNGVLAFAIAGLLLVAIFGYVASAKYR